MPGKRRISYVWVDHLAVADRSLGELSGQARLGLEDAQELAAADRARAAAMLAHEDPLPSRLALEDLAYEVSAATVRRRISLARRELFGSLSDSGIYAREAVRRARVAAETCQECTRPLPARSPNTQGRPREYCDECSTPAARTRRSRRRASV